MHVELVRLRTWNIRWNAIQPTAPLANDLALMIVSVDRIKKILQSIPQLLAPSR